MIETVPCRTSSNSGPLGRIGRVVRHWSVHGTVLADAGWLADRVADAARVWWLDDRRVAATLWWFFAGAALIEPGAAALLAGRVSDPRPAALTFTLDGSGYLVRVVSSGMLPGGPAAYGAALAEGFTPVVDGLAAAGGANPRALWALAADSVASRLLVAAGPRPDLDALGELAGQVAGATGRLLPRPRPRFGAVPGRAYVRRVSCCLVYRVPGLRICDNCPRQTPQQRLARLTAGPAGTAAGRR